MNSTRTLETTLGDLITALTEATAAYVRDEREAYQVVAFMLTHLLNSRAMNRTSDYHQ